MNEMELRKEQRRHSWSKLAVAGWLADGLTSLHLYFGFVLICSLNTSMKRSITDLLKLTPDRMVIGRSIRSCKLLKSNALMRMRNSDTPERIGFTRIFTN